MTLPPDTPADDTIYIAGDFNAWRPDGIPLARIDATRASGVIRIPKRPSIEFKVTRGDWARVEQGSDCAPLGNRSASATRSQTIRVTVGNWADRCVPIYDRRARKVRIDSRTLGVPKEFYVYTPPGYDDSPGERYPVLYLLRGHESEWINKHQDPTRKGRNVIDVYEELFRAGEVGPMLLVFPGIGSDDNSIPGMLVNFKSPALTTARGIGTGRFEDYFLQEVIGYVDAHYRTIAAKGARGVDGFSLGGFMSVKIAAQHPELFATVGAFDGTHFYADANCTRVDAARDPVTFHNGMFDAAFGNPRDTSFAALNNGANLICNADASTMRSLRWAVQYGPESGEPNHSNFFRGEHLIEKLAEKGVANSVPAVLNGGHTWKVADEHMRQTLPLHWEVLRLATKLQSPEPSTAREPARA